jgi:hypothetical protein
VGSSPTSGTTIGACLAALMHDDGIGVRNKRSLDVPTVDDASLEGE